MLADTDRKRSVDLEQEHREAEAQPGDRSSFSNPVTGANADGVSSYESEDVPSVGLPSAVYDTLQVTLGGPRLALDARVWHFLALLVLWSTGYTGWAALPLVDENLARTAVPWTVFCVISGLAWGASSHARWVAYSAHEAPSSARNLPSRPGRLHEPLRDLLQQALFTPDQVSTLLKWTWWTRTFIIVMCLDLWLIYAVMVHHMHRDGYLHLDIIISLCINSVCWTSAFSSVSGGILLDCVCREAIIGHVQPIINRVWTSTPASIDFDELLADIVKAQRLLSAMCTRMQHAIVLQIVALAAAGFACAFLGLGPHPRDPEMWWRKYYVSDFILTFGAAWFLSGIAILFQTSKITSVCDTLGDAINELTETQEPGAEQVSMPTTNHQRNIEHICGYVRGLNRGRGMGFVLFRKRISHSFAVALAMKLTSVMTISFPVILSLTRVEQQEEEILNNTEACTGL